MVASPPERFLGDAVVLRRVNGGDADALFEVAHDPNVMRYMDWPMPQDVHSIGKHLELAAERWRTATEFQWVILEKRTAAVVGTISCRPGSHSADFGYFIGHAVWGRGFAREAGALIVEWLKLQSRLYRIWASTDAENLRSCALLERLGLQLERVHRRATVRPNIGNLPRDTAIYAWCRIPSKLRPPPA